MPTAIVQIQVIPEQREAFIAATELNRRGSRLEPGNRRFDVLQSADDPNAFVLYEDFASATDARAHKETPHYLRWRATVEPMMARPRQATHYQRIGED